MNLGVYNKNDHWIAAGAKEEIPNSSNGGFLVLDGASFSYNAAVFYIKNDGTKVQLVEGYQNLDQRIEKQSSGNVYVKAFDEANIRCQYTFISCR